MANKTETINAVRKECLPSLVEAIASFFMKIQKWVSPTASGPVESAAVLKQNITRATEASLYHVTAGQRGLDSLSQTFNAILAVLWKEAVAGLLKGKIFAGDNQRVAKHVTRAHRRAEDLLVKDEGSRTEEGGAAASSRTLAQVLAARARAAQVSAEEASGLVSRLLAGEGAATTVERTFLSLFVGILEDTLGAAGGDGTVSLSTPAAVLLVTMAVFTAGRFQTASLLASDPRLGSGAPSIQALVLLELEAGPEIDGSRKSVVDRPEHMARWREWFSRVSARPTWRTCCRGTFGARMTNQRPIKRCARR